MVYVDRLPQEPQLPEENVYNACVVVMCVSFYFNEFKDLK